MQSLPAIMAILSSALSRTVESIPVGGTANSDGPGEANVILGRFRCSDWRRLDGENSSEYRMFVFRICDVGN